MTDPNYYIMSPEESFKGKRYIEWIQDWSNWFYQPFPERNNNGDVVFLRSMPLAEGNYQNEPLVLIGNDSLEIASNQRILVPIITATYIADEFESPEWIYGMVRNSIASGDNPPKLGQVKINGEPLQIKVRNSTWKIRHSPKDNTEHLIDVESSLYSNVDPDATDLSSFEFETPVYQIHIPDSSSGPSLREQVEMPLQNPGYFPAVTRGFFVMLELQPNNGYYIECKATGATTTRGPYHVSFLYHVKVRPPANAKGAVEPPERLALNMRSKIISKLDENQLLPKDIGKPIPDLLGISEDQLRQRVAKLGGDKE